MTDWVEYFRAVACGLAVAHVWRGHGSTLFVELGALTPRTRRDGSPGEPEGAIGLMIEWSWRIEMGRSIDCGSDSDEDLWTPAFARLVGREVEGIATFCGLPEVMLSLAGDVRVRSFMTAEGGPAWALFDRRGPRTITAFCRAGVIVSE